MKENKISKLYRILRKRYGQPQGQWSLWCRRPKTSAEKEEVVIGAILTQRVNWKNVELAINNLREANLLSLKAISKLRKQSGKFLKAVRPSGFYKQKAGYLIAIAKFFKKLGGVKKAEQIKTSDLRYRLLALSGVGPETADSILLYGLEKPVFVIDEYTRRLAKKEHLTNNFFYPHLQQLFESSLAKNWKLYQDFHALIVIDGKSWIFKIA